MTDKPWVHFVAICGPTVGSIAILLKNKGWKVTGSDRDIYPPASEYLKKNGINIMEGFDAGRIDPKIDMVILGGGAMIMDRENPEVLRAVKLGLTTISWPHWVADNFIKSSSIVIAGTYGKTTTTAMIAWVLQNARKDPSYLIGGYANNFTKNVYAGSGEYSVTEGDEHPSALYFDDRSKFLYYKPKYVLITSAKWDHFNVFPKESDYVEAYKDLVRLIPDNGLLVLCRSGENLKEIAESAKCKVIWYSDKDFDGELQIIGNFNRENAAGAFTLCKALGISSETILTSLAGFTGVKRRLEKQAETENFVIVEDFAQHPYKVKGVLKTLRDSYPDRKIILVFDPFASILRSKDSLVFYKGSFDLADKVLVRRLKVAVDKNKRVTGPEIIKAMNMKDGRVKYMPLDNEIINEVLQETKQGRSVILFCSSGGWHGLIDKIKENLS